jgi:hypothetical protein
VAVTDESETTERGSSGDDWSFYRAFIIGFFVLIVMAVGRTFDLSYPVLLALGAAGGLALNLVERRLRR